MTGNAPYPTANNLRDMVQKMVSMGPRLTGSQAHQNFVSYLEKTMSDLGLQVTRDHYTFMRWQARAWSLTLDGYGPVDLAGYFPYSGNTGPAGIEARLVSLDLPMENTTLFRDLATFARQTFKRRWNATVERAWAAARGYVKDKIVLVYGPILPITTGVLLTFLTYAKNDDLCRLESSDFKRPWLGSLLFPWVLDFLRDCGAKGVIFHVDVSAENAKGQYLPFSSPLMNAPAVLVNRDVAKELRSLASAHPKAHLTLDADTNPDTCTDSLVATLPGVDYGSQRDECIIVNTHTDGQNAIEENGPIACIAIAQHYAAIPQAQRPRTLVFSLVTGHMGPNLPQTQGFVDRNLDLIGKAACAITIEHLGATEWLDGGQGYHATGRPEFAAAFHSETPISQIAIQTYGASPLTRMALLRPIVDTPISRILPKQSYVARLLRGIYDTRWRVAYFGVGAPLHEAGVPSMGYLTGPNYLVTISKNHEMDKFDPERMRLETEWVIDTLHRLESVPARQLRLNSSLRHRQGLIFALISIPFSIWLTIAAIKLVNDDPFYLLVLCAMFVFSLVISASVYALVRFRGWIRLRAKTDRFWRDKIKYRRILLLVCAGVSSLVISASVYALARFRGWVRLGAKTDHFWR